MTACVNSNQKREGARRAVGATLAGVLAVGMVPAAAFAQEGDEAADEGISTQAVGSAQAFQNGAINGATKAVEYTYNTEAQYVVPATVVLGNGDEIDVTNPNDYKVAYYDDSNALVEPSAIKDAGTYTVKVTCVNKDSEYNAATATATFTIKPANLSAATAYVINDEDKNDFSATDAVFSNEDLIGKIAFVIDGKKVDTTNQVEAVWSESEITYAGTYTATLTATPNGNYTGYKQTQFTVKPFDLATATLELPDISDTYVEPSNDDLIVNGKEDAAIKDLLSLAFKTNSNGDYTIVDSPANGSYTYTVKNAKADSTVEADKKAKASIVNSGEATFAYAEKAATITYDGSAPKGIIYDRSDADSKALDLSKIKATYNNGQKNVEVDTVVTAVNKETGEKVDPATLSAAGTYSVTIRVDAAANDYKCSGSETFVYTIREGLVDMDAGTYVSYKGEVTDAVVATYSGKDVTDDITVVVTSADGKKTLAEGTDYVVEYSKDGKKVDEVVDAGNYIMTVKSTGAYAVAVGGQMSTTVNIVVDKLAIAAYQANTGDITVIPYTGEAITPDFQYTTEKKETGTKWVGLDPSLYTVTYTFTGELDGKKVTDYKVSEVKAVGTYTATIKLTDEAAKNYAAPTVKTAAFKVAEKSKFQDVDASAWYAGVVSKASELGYMNGIGGSLFAPDNAITRGQVVCVLFNMAGMTMDENKDKLSFWSGTVTPFSDVDSGMYYAGPIAWAAKSGVVNGYGDGTFAPEQTITREEFACMLANYAKIYGGYETVDADKVLAEFPDGSAVSGWAKANVAWAASAEIMGNGGVINPAADITRAETAAMAVNYQPKELNLDL